MQNGNATKIVKQKCMKHEIYDLKRTLITNVTDNKISKMIDFQSRTDPQHSVVRFSKHKTGSCMECQSKIGLCALNLI